VLYQDRSRFRISQDLDLGILFENTLERQLDDLYLANHRRPADRADVDTARDQEPTSRTFAADLAELFVDDEQSDPFFHDGQERRVEAQNRSATFLLRGADQLVQALLLHPALVLALDGEDDVENIAALDLGRQVWFTGEPRAEGPREFLA
jgi:hypothetical protein